MGERRCFDEGGEGVGGDRVGSLRSGPCQVAELHGKHEQPPG